MRNIHERLGYLWLIILTITACTPQELTVEPNPGAIQTSMARSVAGTVTAYVETVQPTPRDTPTVSLTPEETLTPTPYMVTFHTLTEVNCRSRTDEMSDLILVLPAGFEGIATIRDPESRYIFYTSPGEPANSCWIFTELIKYSGNLKDLVEITSLPSPTLQITPIPIADFSISYVVTTVCGWTRQTLKVTNTGKQIWESWRVVFTDTVSGVASAAYGRDIFYGTSCKENYDYRKILDPSATFSIYYINNSEEKGHPIRGSITLCSEDNLEGFCLTKELVFTP